MHQPIICTSMGEEAWRSRIELVSKPEARKFIVCSPYTLLIEPENMKKRIIFLRSNPVSPDPRVEKEARALAQAGHIVRVFCWDRSGFLPKLECNEFGVIERTYIKAKYGSGFINFFPLALFNFALIWYLFRHARRYDIIHACDFDVVLPAIFIKWVLKKKVVYDIFDFYSDMLRNTPKLIKGILRRLDLKLIGVADAVIIADESRRRQIVGSNPKHLVVVYNSPELPDKQIKSDFQFFCIVYVGLLQRERGIMQIIQVMRDRPDWRLELAGFGGDEDVIVKACSGMSNVQYHGRVSYSEALKMSSMASALFATYDPVIPNHRYSSANKLFEAMALGKPIVVARGTGMDEIVTKFELGHVVEYGDIDQLRSVLDDLSMWAPEKRERFAAHARKVYEEYFSWDIMKDKLLNLYKQL